MRYRHLTPEMRAEWLNNYGENVKFYNRISDKTEKVSTVIKSDKYRIPVVKFVKGGVLNP